MLTHRDISILDHLARYYVLSRAQIQRLDFPHDNVGRVTRRRLQFLVSHQFIRRMPLLLTCPTGDSCSGSIYYPARMGLEVLAEHYGDDRYLLATTRTPQPHRARHWLAVSDTHIALDQALLLNPQVHCPSFVNEWDVVNPEETEPSKRFRLYLVIEANKPRLVAAPDGGFLLEVAGHRKVAYLEQDRNTSSVSQIVASKHKGYAAMEKLGLQRKHFPDETTGSFVVLMIVPSDRRRELLRKAFCGHPGEHLWRFVTQGDLTPERFLFEPIFYRCDGEAVPLILPGALRTVAVSAHEHVSSELVTQ